MTTTKINNVFLTGVPDRPYVRDIEFTGSVRAGKQLCFERGIRAHTSTIKRVNTHNNQVDVFIHLDFKHSSFKEEFMNGLTMKEEK